MQCDAYVIFGARCIGCSLSANMRLPIREEFASAFKYDRKPAEVRLVRLMVDFQSISDEGVGAPRGEYFRPVDMLAIHRQRRARFVAELAKPLGGPTVVVTHPRQHPHSAPPDHKPHWITMGCSSRMPHKFFNFRRLWVHGHVHASLNSQVGRRRIVGNPRGYSLTAGRDLGQFQNRAWCRRGYNVEV